MISKLHRTGLAATAVAALAGSALAPLASADAAPAKHKTLTVCAKSAYIDAPAPGNLFTGTIFKGEHFHVDRSARVKSGSAKGLWYHGSRIATGKRSTYKVTGWIKSSAFCG